MNIGVQTRGIIEPGVSPFSGFSLIAEAGFTKVDYNLDVFLKNSDIYGNNLNDFFDVETEKLVEYFAIHRKAMDQVGIVPSQMHAPYPVKVPRNDNVTYYMVNVVIPKSIKIASVLGVPWVVIHPFKLQYTHGKDMEHEANFLYFKSLIPMLKENGVRVCMENLYESIGGRIVEGVCSNPREAARYIDELNREAGEELFGFCLDAGHLQLSKRDPYEFIMTLGDRLKILHLHENNGEEDLHEIPFTFGREYSGVQDWDGICQALAKTGFEGTLSFETFPSMNAFPYTVQKEVLDVICSCGDWLKMQIEDYKERIASMEQG